MLKQMVEHRLPDRLAKLPYRYQMVLHNMVGHPLMEVFKLVGFKNTSQWVHKVTLPTDQYHENVSRNSSEFF
jgi:hypothetical protein